MLRTPRALPSIRRQCTNGNNTAEAAAEMSDLQSRYEVLLAMVQNLQSLQNTDTSPKTPSPVGRVGEEEGGKEKDQGAQTTA